MKSLGFVVIGFAGQIVAMFALYGLAHLDMDISERSFLVLWTVALAVIGAAATIAAGLVASGRGRLWALGLSGLLFAVVVLYTAAAVDSLQESG